MLRADKIANRTAFTLVELMISIAMVLVLMLGINLIFQTTGKAVGAGQAISEGLRSSQAAQSIMKGDLANTAVDDGPFIMIYSRSQPAFRNKQDQLSDADYNPGATALEQLKQMLTIDLNNDNVEGDPNVVGEIIPKSIYNSRNHRVDMLCFFSRDVFKRQTGNPGTYVADQSAQEAMIWYGHLALYNGSGSPQANGSYPAPGQLSANDTLVPVPPTTFNPNNLYATQWIVGREAVLLQEEKSGGGISDKGGQGQFFIREPDPQWNGMGTPANIAPLQYNAPQINSLPNVGVGSCTIQNSRYDLAATSINAYRKRLRAWITGNVADAPWWDFTPCRDLAGTNVPAVTTGTQRFQANPFVAKPIDSAQFARTSPIFLAGCTQFIVEYAGDFIKQNDNGTVVGTGLHPDGQIDFVVLNPGTANERRQIRWYGLPRNTDLRNDEKAGQATIGLTPDAEAPGGYGDVVPLRDLAGTITSPNEFQRLMPPAGAAANYAAPGAIAAGTAFNYFCVFGPKDLVKPSMIRITIVLDDPEARLTDGQTFEYVFRLK